MGRLHLSELRLVHLANIFISIAAATSHFNSVFDSTKTSLTLVLIVLLLLLLLKLILPVGVISFVVTVKILMSLIVELWLIILSDAWKGM